MGQALFDYFCGDVDANLREMGVGDMAVPRKMKAVAEAFYGRKRAYEAALAAPGIAELAAALARNVYPETGETAEAERLAAYVREAVDKLAAIDGAALLRGQVAFPDPRALSRRSRQVRHECALTPETVQTRPRARRKNAHAQQQAAMERAGRRSRCSGNRTPFRPGGR